MAARCTHLEADLSCPVCYSIFKDPVVLSCSHSICKPCLQSCWASSDSQDCPVCRRRSSKMEPHSNLVLKNVCESFRQRCCLHSEQLTLFCLEDEQPVCPSCQTSGEHKNHDCRPIRETVDGYKRELETALTPLQEKLCSYMNAKRTSHQTTKHLKNQAWKAEYQIRLEFDELHQFLIHEEEARMAALREEEKLKSQLLTEENKELGSVVTFLSETIKTIEDDLRAEDLSFLQNFKSSMESSELTLGEDLTSERSSRAQSSLKDPQVHSGMLIDMARHLGNLKFRVWEKIQEIVQYTPVILDPNTAHPSLSLSDDLTSVTFIGEHSKDKSNVTSEDNEDDVSDEVERPGQRPDNPERFDECACVLGSEGFSSGSVFWDVEVGDNYLWEVGITTESNQRKGVHFYNGIWSVESNGGFYTRSPEKPKCPFSAEGGLPTIRVQLDWDRGEVSFFDPVNDMDIITFSHTFTEKVYPFFWTRRSKSPVKILPVTPEIVLQQPL